MIELIFLASLTSLILGSLILYRSKGRMQYVFFGLLAVINGVWILTNALTGIYPIDFWSRATYALGSLSAGFGLVWAFHLREKKVSRRKFVPIIILSFLFSILSFVNGWVIDRIDSVYLGGFEGSVGPLFSLYAIYAVITLLGINYILFIQFRRSKGIQREQLRYILIGALVFSMTSLLVSFILPQFGVLKLSPLDSPSSLVFTGLIFYSVTRYRFMDIQLVVSRSILYFLLIVAVSATLVFGSVISVEYLREELRLNPIVLSIIFSVLIVIGIDPLKRYLSRITDKIFYKGSINYQSVLRELSEVLSSHLDLDEVTDKALNSLISNLRLKGAALVLLASNQTRNIYNEDLVLSDQSAIDDLVNNKLIVDARDVILRDELDRRIYDSISDIEIKELERAKDLMDSLQISGVVPIKKGETLTGLIFLGVRLAGDSYSELDVRLFEVLTPQLATAIERSKLYEEVQAFNVKLQERVDQATADLQKANVSLGERNQHLLAIQKINNFITKGLDLKTVMQEIADGIAGELGFVGGIITFADEEKERFQVAAVTQNALTRQAIKLVPQDPTSYWVPYDLDAPGAIAGRTGRVQVGDSLVDFISPPLPRLLASAIDKVLGVKTAVAMPISSEEQTIGVIDYALKKTQPEVTPGEWEMMRTVADQIGIAYRKLRLYQQLQEANVHLKELDNAKSEFLSIASHQLRTPLSGIKGYLSMLMDGDLGTMKANQKKVVTDMFTSADRMTRLVNVFLSVSRIEQGHFNLDLAPADPAELAQVVIDELLPGAVNKGLELKLVKAGALPSLRVDKDKVRDVLLNLVDNAIKYTVKGKVEVRLQHDEGGVTFEVVDTGMGISVADLQKLSGKFVRGTGSARVNTDGSGLGLFIARKVVEAHGGKFWINSPGAGQGSTFGFSLPIEPPATAVALSAKPTEVGEKPITVNVLPEGQGGPADGAAQARMV